MMKITVNLTKAELDLIEEALLQYQNLLLKSKDQDEMVNDELKLARRVLEEFGMEGWKKRCSRSNNSKKLCRCPHLANTPHPITNTARLTNITVPILLWHLINIHFLVKGEYNKKLPAGGELFVMLNDA